MQEQLQGLQAQLAASAAALECVYLYAYIFFNVCIYYVCTAPFIRLLASLVHTSAPHVHSRLCTTVQCAPPPTAASRETQLALEAAASERDKLLPQVEESKWRARQLERERDTHAARAKELEQVDSVVLCSTQWVALLSVCVCVQVCRFVAVCTSAP